MKTEPEIANMTPEQIAFTTIRAGVAWDGSLSVQVLEEALSFASLSREQISEAKRLGLEQHEKSAVAD